MAPVGIAYDDGDKETTRTVVAVPAKSLRKPG